MTRESFINSTDSSDDDVLLAYERLMGLYGMLKAIGYDDIGYIKVLSDSSFCILAATPQMASKVMSNLDGSRVCVYGKSYDIHCELVDTLIKIYFI